MKSVKRNEKISGSYTEKYQDQIHYSFAYKLVCIDNKFSKLVVLYRGEKAAYNFIKINTVKKWWKNILTKVWSLLKRKKKIFDRTLED